MQTTTRIRPGTGLTAAQQAVLRETGVMMSHSAAVHHLADQLTMARTRLHRLVGTEHHIAAPIVQRGCRQDCAQGRRCTCSGAPLPTLAPRKALCVMPSRIEQHASDFGVLDLDLDEADIPDHQLGMSDADQFAATAYRWAWRIAIVVLVAIIGMAAFTTPAHAANTIGLHVASWHGRSGYNNTNPGVLYRADSGLTLGAYCNSESRSARFIAAPRCRISTYAGWHWDWQVADSITVGVTAGALTGYARARVLPFVVPSVRIGDHIRLLYAPAIEPKGTQVVSLVLETEF